MLLILKSLDVKVSGSIGGVKAFLVQKHFLVVKDFGYKGFWMCLFDVKGFVSGCFWCHQSTGVKAPLG